MSIIQFALTSHHRFVDILDCQLLVLSHRQHVLIWAWKNAAARKELPYQFFFFYCRGKYLDLRYFSALSQNPTKRVKQKFIFLWVRPSKDSLEFQISLCFESFVPPFASLVFFQLLLGGVLSPTWFWIFIWTLPLTTCSQTSVPCFPLSAPRSCWDWEEDQSAVGDNLRYCTEQQAAILYGSIVFQIFVPASRKIQIIWIV